MATVTLDEAISNITHILPYSLKDQQIKCIKGLCSGQSVFGLLPTGYGKSDVLTLPPLVMDKLQDGKHISIVITPTKALIHDQVQRWTGLGVKSAGLTQDTDKATAEGIKSGAYSVVFASPESAVLPAWVDVWKRLRNRICVLCVDEAHCLIQWGSTFRPMYKKIARLRGLLCDTPVALVTATATQSMKNDIMETMGVEADECLHISEIPNRANIYISHVLGKADEHISLKWVLELLKIKKTKAPKIIVFCRSMDLCLDMFAHFYSELGNEIFLKDLPDDQTEDCRLLDAFHANVEPEALTRIPRSFSKPGSNLRCLFSTIAFGLGMQVPDVDIVIHWGPSDDILQYWQEVGRCGRDGRDGKAILYTPSNSVNKAKLSKEMLQYVTLPKSSCLRQFILTHLKLNNMLQDDIDSMCGGAKCCSNCDSNA